MRVSHAILGLSLTFATATFLLYSLASLLPSSKSGYVVSFPKNLNQLKDLEAFLKEYKRNHYTFVVVLFVAGYLYKQTFAIPGSVFINVLAGAVFGIWTAVPLTCVLTAIGATCCYMLSNVFGRNILHHYFPHKLKDLQQKVEESKDGLFYFLLCLRLFPMSPNWFLNMASPILGIPITYFTPSVLIGLLPYNLICCQTGSILSEITSVHEMFTPEILVKLVLLACLVASPGVLIRLHHQRKQKQ